MTRALNELDILRITREELRNEEARRFLLSEIAPLFAIAASQCRIVERRVIP